MLTVIGTKLLLVVILMWALVFPLAAQQANQQIIDEPEDWNLYYQATSVGSYHGTFPAPYTGPLSLQDYPERDVSLTSTFFSLPAYSGIQRSCSIRNSREVAVSVV
jgi:hypothetical protein